MFAVKQDNHSSATLSLEEFRGVPVLVHSGGRYPSIVDDAGVSVDRYIGIVEWSNGFVVTGHSGYRHGGRMEALSVGTATSVEAARALLPAALVAIEQAPTLFAQAREIYGKYAPWAGPLSRVEYERLAADLGFPARQDAELSTWGDFTFPECRLDILPKFLTDQRRAFSYERELSTSLEAASRSAALNRKAEVAFLRTKPVLSTEARFGPVGTPDEFLRKGRLHTVVIRSGRRRITEDDPSVEGSHLLGHEGEEGETVTVEIRGP